MRYDATDTKDQQGKTSKATSGTNSRLQGGKEGHRSAKWNNVYKVGAESMKYNWKTIIRMCCHPSSQQCVTKMSVHALIDFESPPVHWQPVSCLSVSCLVSPVLVLCLRFLSCVSGSCLSPFLVSPFLVSFVCPVSLIPLVSTITIMKLEVWVQQLEISVFANSTVSAHAEVATDWAVVPWTGRRCFFFFFFFFAMISLPRHL